MNVLRSLSRRMVGRIMACEYLLKYTKWCIWQTRWLHIFCHLLCVAYPSVSRNSQSPAFASIRSHSLVKINMAEGSGRSFVEGTEGEPMISEYSTLLLASKLPNAVRWLAQQVLSKRKSYLLGCARKLVAYFVFLSSLHSEGIRDFLANDLLHETFLT